MLLHVTRIASTVEGDVMSQHIRSAAVRFAVCLLAIGLTAALFLGGRNWGLAQVPPAIDPAKVDRFVRADDEVRSPLLRSMLAELDRAGNGDLSAEERKRLRADIIQADAELSRSLGPNLR